MRRSFLWAQYFKDPIWSFPSIKGEDSKTGSREGIRRQKNQIASVIEKPETSENGSKQKRFEKFVQSYKLKTWKVGNEGQIEKEVLIGEESEKFDFLNDTETGILWKPKGQI